MRTLLEIVIYGEDLKTAYKDYLILFFLSGSIIGLDQWTKSIIRANLELGSTWLPVQLEWLAPYARIVHWYNTGAAFGLFKNGSTIITILAIIVSGVILYYFPRIPSRDWWLRLAMAMQLGGAVGNLIDRLMFGQVTDFISVGTFPVFNIADSSLSVGVAVLIIGIWLTERGERKKSRQDDFPNEHSESAVRQGEGQVEGE